MKSYLIAFFLIFGAGLGAQEKTHDIDYIDEPLGVVLAKLETLYGVKFSYNSKTIKNLSVSIDLEAASLDLAIASLEGQTLLIFEPIDKRYYVIKTKTQVDICGYLQDGSGKVIEGASIAPLSNERGTISDVKGFFKLENTNISDTLTVSYLGFKKLVLPVRGIDPIDCRIYIMFTENFLLNEVIVKEYLAAGIFKTRDGSIRIRPNNLEILSGLSEPDVLQNTQLLPGVESPSETASGLFIRGGTPDQNLILWDGIKMYNSDHFFGMLSAFNPYIVKEARIYRSGTKVGYGDRVSGVVDIRTDDAISARTQGGLGLNLTHADAFIKTPLSDKIGIQLSARRALTDVFNSPTFDQFTEKVFQNTSIVQNQNVFEPEFTNSKELFYFTDLTFKAMAELSGKDKIAVSGIYTRNKLDYSYEDTEFIDASSDALKVDNLGASAIWTHSWSTSFSSRLKTYYSAYDLNYDGMNQFIDQEISVNKKNDIEEVGLAFHSDWTIAENAIFSNGYQFFDNQVAYTLEDDFLTESDQGSNQAHTIYNQLDYQVKNWYIDIGLRTNYYSKLKAIYFEPRCYVERKIGEMMRFKGSAEIKNQSVSQIIEFATQDFGLENQIWALANDTDIPLLQSDQFSAGFSWHKKGWNLDVEAYRKNIRGLTSLTRGFESANDLFAQGKSTTTGIDFLAKKKVGDYSTWLGYTHSRTNFDFTELNGGSTFRGNNDVAHSLTWSHFYKWGRLQFSLGWKCRTGIPYTEALGTINMGDDIQIEYGEINARTLPDYHRLDFSFLYDFEISKKGNPVSAKFGFSLLNIYGRQNLLSKSYALFDVVDDQDNVAVALREITRYSLGMTPNLVFRLQF